MNVEKALRQEAPVFQLIFTVIVVFNVFNQEDVVHDTVFKAKVIELLFVRFFEIDQAVH